MACRHSGQGGWTARTVHPPGGLSAEGRSRGVRCPSWWTAGAKLASDVSSVQDDMVEPSRDGHARRYGTPGGGGADAHSRVALEEGEAIPPDSAAPKESSELL